LAGVLTASLLFAAGVFASALPFAGDFATLALGSGFFARTFLFAADVAPLDFALPAGRFAFAAGRTDFFGIDFLRAGRADAFALPFSFLFAAGLRGFAFACDLRPGFAGFLAMGILEFRYRWSQYRGDRENLKLYHLVIRHWAT
jgi:hypothetical protein